MVSLPDAATQKSYRLASDWLTRPVEYWSIRFEQNEDSAMCLRTVMATFALVLPSLAQAQTLTVEELRAQIDARVEALNPYAELLNDPDPARSMAAMQIMVQSGDPVLEEMAIEFGILSSDREVQTEALFAFLSKISTVTVQLDGSEYLDQNFSNLVRNNLRGAVGQDGMGFITFEIGQWDASRSCFGDQGSCIVTLNGNSVVFLTGQGRTDYFSGRSEINNAGQLVGFGSIYALNSDLPTLIEILK